MTPLLQVTCVTYRKQILIKTMYLVLSSASSNALDLKVSGTGDSMSESQQEHFLFQSFGPEQLLV
jgi:hypothetical protein